MFAVGFLSRPLGALVFGAIGDRFGRKPVLLIVFPMMFLCTAAIGLLPTYKQVGWIAPCLLIMVRVFQGMSIGGQYTGSITYIAEFVTDSRKQPLALSYPWIFSNIGFILASVVCYVYKVFLEQHVPEFWQWRLPFLTSVVSFLFMSWRSAYLPETPVFLESQHHQQTIKKMNPFLSIYHFPKASVCCVAMTAPLFVTYYVLFVFLITYLPLHNELSSNDAVLINGLALVIQTLVIPIPAMLSIKWGQKKIFYLSSILMAILIYPSFMLFKLQQVWISLSVLTILSMICSGFYISSSVAMIEAFPVKYRLSGTSLSYNTAAALFGGTAPLIASLMVTYFNDVLAPAYYLIFWSLIGMAGMFFIRKAA